MQQDEIKNENADSLQLKECVPEEFKIVEVIARQFANSNEEFETYYSVGLKAAERFKLMTAEDTSNQWVRFSAWVIRQSIVTHIHKV